MFDRRSLLRTGSAATLGAIALTAVAGGTDLATAAANNPDLLGDPSQDPSEQYPFPKRLTHQERLHLKRFDELDFVVYSGQQWSRLGESHSDTIRVHWPDGHYTDGIDRHIEDLKAQFVWAPDTRISQHPIRIAKDNLTAVTGVSRGTFSRPMPDGQGGFIQPTGQKFAINMVTVGLWNKRGVMDEEFLFWDAQTFMQQIGVG
ncbi:hypothetical protein AB0O01_25430 [Streptomyces sp. NPDC093252]|uniref:hypothetical protein n=1 Tax=Streptomyces sp. NPDC093252 TaxID=3154980 RepID=UPI0034495CA3